MSFTARENDQRIRQELAAAARRLYIPGPLYPLALLLMTGGFFATQPHSREVVGWDGAWSVLRLVLVVVWFGAVLATNFLFSMISVILLFLWATGQSYVEDRVAFTRAGAYDLGLGMPLLSPTVVYLYYWATARGLVSAPLPDVLRGPWAFWGMTLVFSLVACTALAGLLFRVLRPRFPRRSF